MFYKGLNHSISPLTIPTHKLFINALDKAMTGSIRYKIKIARCSHCSSYSSEIIHTRAFPSSYPLSLSFLDADLCLYSRLVDTHIHTIQSSALPSFSLEQGLSVMKKKKHDLWTELFSDFNL